MLQIDAAGVRRPALDNTRVVFGRRHPFQSLGDDVPEMFVPVAELPEVSARWFTAEPVDLHDASGSFLRRETLLTCTSVANSVTVWDSGTRIRLDPGDVYIVRHWPVYVGDLWQGSPFGARLDSARSGEPGAPLNQQPVASPASAGRTRPVEPLPLTERQRRILVARYRGYYLPPPAFDPQPLEWAEVARLLDDLSYADVADDRLRRRATNPLSGEVSKVKKAVEDRHPGWLPDSGETSKSFHDHLRLILEREGLFTTSALRAFAVTIPRARVRPRRARHGW